MLDDYLYYCDTSPTGLRWKVDRYSGKDNRILKVKAGQVAGSTAGANGRYFEVCVNGKSYWCHIAVWRLVNGNIPPGQKVDHLDGNGFNNSLENLCLKTHKANMQNQKKRNTNTSGVTGVSATPVGWKARWQTEEGKTASKSFKNKDEAINYRTSMLLQLNSNGENYTERHGK